MSVPSMVHRSGDTLVVRSVVSGDALFEEEKSNDAPSPPPLLQQDKDLPECKVKRNYSCGTCDFFTQNPRSYLYHLRDVHNEKVRIYECPNCLYASKHFQKLLRHTKMVHGESAEFTKKSRKRPAAPISEEIESPASSSCDSSTSQPQEDEVEPSIPEKTTLKCSLCSFVAKSHVQLSRHESEKHIKTKFFRCTKCTYVTHMKARFTKHVKYHSMPMIKCDMCDFRTPYKWNLDRHCKNHNGRGAFRCSACNFTADIKQSLTVHEMNHHVPPVGQAAGLGVGRRRNKVGASDTTAAEEAASQVQSEPELSETAPRSSGAVTTPKLKILAKKKSNGEGGGGDFVHPDDIVHHANGNVYLKTKCKSCNFKTAWDGEMARHEERCHGAGLLSPAKKKTRPVPNLIPITPQRKETPTMSQKDINEICARSANSALRDFASLFGSEDVLPPPPKEPEVKKKRSFLDKMHEKISGEATDVLSCRHCGHESKCLTEAIAHQKTCGKEVIPALSNTTVHNLSSTRCQHCRQRCKSSKDLLNHLQTCSLAAKFYSQQEEEAQKSEEEDSRSSEKEHPMVNKVFVWNNIEVPMDLEIDEPNQYEYIDDNRQEDNISIDLSIRTQSPCSENSNIEVIQPTPQTFDKVPTHGNDISVAQHKRVFKCPHCTFWASTASRFHVHIVGHLNKKPFECSLCAYRSNWRWDITKHIKLKSVRDPAHESAKVLMTDETGRRNYTKYNKYLTEIHVNGGADAQETSGGMGTRPKHHDGKHELPKSKTGDFGGLSKGGALRPPPALKAADEFLRLQGDKKRSGNDGKKTMWQCKKCSFRDPCRDKLLAHVRGHYPQTATASCSPSSSTSSMANCSLTPQGLAPGASGSSLAGSAGQRCHTGSDLELDTERHCRLKHSGDIKVIVASKSLEKSEAMDEDQQIESKELISGIYKCTQCPYTVDDCEEFQAHKDCHTASSTSAIKCFFCNYFVAQKEDLYKHLMLHDLEPKKRYKCSICPYVTNSKSQFMYHKQFHKPRNGQYGCSECSYNVSKRHLLHQHMKVHGITVSPQKQNGDPIEMEEVVEEIEEIQQQTCDWQHLPEIPLVWVSKSGKFSKMYKCRYCPHVNLRKVNIQEHEKMHGIREKNPSRSNEIEHHCPDCNYVCNNAGVLSSHSKVHQGLYGNIHGLVDTTKTDDEQIRELGQVLASPQIEKLEEEEEKLETDMLNFCSKCPARFLKEPEYEIHLGFHGAELTYRCEHCTYTARQKAHLLAHSKVHTKEYQERTRTLVETSRINPENPPPDVIQAHNEIYIAETDSDFEDYKPQKLNVPISGTELFLQKSEAEANADGSASPKNGKIRKYKCPKCPTHFERLELYKNHLASHGSKQQYKCTQCDYSVKSPTNLLQHEKRHKSECDDDILSSPTSEDKKLFWCPMCPYTNHRKDAVDNHTKRHVSVSGLQNNYTCQHCDYSVPQSHFLRDHVKLHFQPNKVHVPEAYMSCDYMKLSAVEVKVEDVDEEDDEEELFESKAELEPLLKVNLNNNEDEKVYVNVQTGDVVKEEDDVEMAT